MTEELGKLQDAKVKAGVTTDGRGFQFGIPLLPYAICLVRAEGGVSAHAGNPNRIEVI